MIIYLRLIDIVIRIPDKNLSGSTCRCVSFDEMLRTTTLELLLAQGRTDSVSNTSNMRRTLQLSCIPERYFIRIFKTRYLLEQTQVGSERHARWKQQTAARRPTWVRWSVTWQANRKHCEWRKQLKTAATDEQPSSGRAALLAYRTMKWMHSV